MGKSKTTTSRPAGRPSAGDFWCEGDDGLFSQTWYPVCVSADVGADNVIGRTFLDGEVIVYRGADGSPHVFGAYCVHMGANLKEGTMVDHCVRCPYHHWQFDDTGQCVKTGSGDPPPPSANLFEYPTVERWGLIFAFNGTEPLWQLPDFADVLGERCFDDVELCTSTGQLDYFPDDPTTKSIPLDPWMIITNPLDFQHFVSVHEMTFRAARPEDEIVWSDHKCEFRMLSTNRFGTPYDNHQAIYGNNCLYLSGNLNGKWFGFFAAQSIPEPGKSDIYFVGASEKASDSEEDVAAAQAAADGVVAMETEFFMQDISILRSLHFRPGLLTKTDTALKRHIDYLQGQPRAHPGADFIR